MAMHKRSLELWSNSTEAVAREIDSLFKRNDWTSTYVGHGDDGAAWAIDFMCSKAMGDAIAEYLWANRIRLGIWYVIWNRRIISRTRPDAGWQWYYDGNSSNPSRAHTNHVHASRYEDADYTPPKGSQKPSAPVSRPVKTKPTPGKPKPYPRPKNRIVYDDRVGPGVKNSDSVWHVQFALNEISFKGGREIPLTGNYDKATIAEVKKFQAQKCHDPADGDLGPKQTRYLFEVANVSVRHRKSSK